MAFMIPYAGADPQEARRIRATKVSGSKPRPRKPQPRIPTLEELEDEEIFKVAANPAPPEFPNLDIPAMPPAVRHLLFKVARKYKVHPNQVAGTCRRAQVGMARREVSYRCRVELKLSFARIGRYLRKDHSTIVYACQMWETGKPIYGVYPILDIDFAPAAADGSG